MTDPRRALPAMDRVLAIPDIATLVDKFPRALVLAAAREVLAAARTAGGVEPHDGWARAVTRRVADLASPSLRPVINATGVVLHTNLGRAPLAPDAIEAMARVGERYSTLEYDLDKGERGSRHEHCRRLLVELTGAADALVVNNAAGALLLGLNALAEGGEAVVSRGELVEIGGAFRIPDIMTKSGARLVEVGTTNRTHAADYEGASTSLTRAFLKVHRSNFRVTGFTAEVSATDVVSLARSRGVAAIYDVGSGLLLDLSDVGLSGEPTLPTAVATGAELVVASGDKLLGGPQAGILLGTEAAVARCRANPLARAVRADKFTLAGLAATLAYYREPDRARREIPVLRMLTEPVAETRARAEAIRAALPPAAGAGIVDGESEVGGGSFPGTTLSTSLVTLGAAPGSRLPAPDVLATRLRQTSIPVIGRIHDGRVVLDARTITDDDVELLAAAVSEALNA
jgi:L-seryl-tRNA(Ser) seleniumtransferase